MSYGLPEQPRRRSGLGRLIFPAILFFGALMIFRSMSGPRAEAIPEDYSGRTGVISPNNSTAEDPYKIKEDLFEPKAASDNYSIKEGLFEKGTTPMPSQRRENSAVTREEGQWSIQEVNATGESDPPTATPKSNKTQNGQWSIEEVDGKAEPKKPRFKFTQ
jgi:hypothetical protein